MGILVVALLATGGLYLYFSKKGEKVAEAAKTDDGSGGSGGSAPDATKPALGLGSSLTDTIIPTSVGIPVFMPARPRRASEATEISPATMGRPGVVQTKNKRIL